MKPLIVPCKAFEFESVETLPPPSASRTQRNISLLSGLGPYQNKSPLVETIQLTVSETRLKEKILADRRRPITNATAKVRGGESFAIPTLPNSVSNSTADEITMSLVILGGKSCLVPPSDPLYIDPDLLLAKPPGFPTGISLAQRQVADETFKLESERKRRLLEENKESEEAPPLPLPLISEVVVDVSPYPENEGKKQRQKIDEYDKMQVKPWSVLDESDVSDFYIRVPKLAIAYDFELDDFQKRSVIHLENGESVFVAAHTSAGKTVVAEYAIALAFEHRTRLVYTSPIKALSNQKFRDFSEKFGDKKVGLLTGDNSVNPDAPCVVMTTEILRSMLYRGAEMIRDVEFVVFDEIHYVNDADRGVIWEEVIIMLPPHVHVIMLSATTPNTMEFSAWVGRNRQEQVFVVSTNKRPVPLEHFLYVKPGEKFLLMDPQNRFRAEAHKEACEAMRRKDPFAEVPGKNAAASLKRDNFFTSQKFASGSGGGSRNVKTGENRWLDLIKDLQKSDMLPVIVFTFSKKQVEIKAQNLLKVDLLNSKAEKSRVHVIFHQALQRLQVADRNLPQIYRVSELLSRGIGIHHGGLLPILKEVVEICFTSGLVRALIATETFAMGVNAPCRTVVFSGLKKHDGYTYRELLPGEYIQMGGRSGRRGIDTVGSVLIMCEDDVPPLDVLSRMLTGKSAQLESRFRLRYNMILNLLRTDELSVSDMLKRSFSEFSTVSIRSEKQSQIKRLKKELVVKRQTLDAFVSNHPTMTLGNMEAYHSALVTHGKCLAYGLGDVLSGRRGQRAQENVLKAGRVLVCSLPDVHIYSMPCIALQLVPNSSSSSIVCLGYLPKSFSIPDTAPLFPLVSTTTPVPQTATTTTNPTNKPVLGTLVAKRKKKDEDEDDEFTVKKKPNKSSTGTAPLSAPPPVNYPFSLPPRALFGRESQDSVVLVLCVISLSELELVSSLVVECSKGTADKLCSLCRTQSDAVQLIAPLIAATEENFLPPALSLSELCTKSDFEITDMWNRAEEDRQKLVLQSPCHELEPSFRNRFRALARDVVELDDMLNKLVKETSDASLALFPDFQARLQVLHLRSFLHYEEGIELKGRVACEINTCDELLLTEMVFDNVMDELSPEEIASLLSALVLQGKCEDQVEPPTPGLAWAWERTNEIAQELVNVQEEAGVKLADDWLTQVLNPGLLVVVFEWARGRQFSSLMALTSLEEGTIVRAITRLDETCREVKNIARLLGNPQLLMKVETASQLIKRDIVFATSLYVG